VLQFHFNRKTLSIIAGLTLEHLSPNAPELNPIEDLWAHCKHRELPNVCAKNLWDLSGLSASCYRISPASFCGVTQSFLMIATLGPTKTR